MKRIAIEHDGEQTCVLHGCTQKEQLAKGSHCKLVVHIRCMNRDTKEHYCLNMM
jgi:hypothetical protein